MRGALVVAGAVSGRVCGCVGRCVRNMLVHTLTHTHTYKTHVYSNIELLRSATLLYLLRMCNYQALPHPGRQAASCVCAPVLRIRAVVDATTVCCVVCTGVWGVRVCRVYGCVGCTVLPYILRALRGRRLGYRLS